VKKKKKVKHNVIQTVFPKGHKELYDYIVETKGKDSSARRVRELLYLGKEKEEEK